MNPDEYRFTDNDVRAHPELAQVASFYLARYTGEFTPLRELLDHLSAGGTLNVPQTRLVLNCMRNDPHVRIVDPPMSANASTDYFARNVNVIPFKRPTKPKLLPPPPPPVIRYPVSMRTKWKMVVGYATTTGKARRLHLLDRSQSGLTYFPSQDKVEVRMHWTCSDVCRAYGDRETYMAQLVTVQHALQLMESGDGWQWCGSCSNITRGRMERSAR